MQKPGETPLVVGVTILAAGRSRRMGQPKLVLPWGDTSVLGHLIRAWTKLHVGQIAVVCTDDARVLHEELDRLAFSRENRILNPDPDRGMFSSIQCASAWSGWRPELTHWIVTPGDQPHLRMATLQGLLDFAAANPDRICQPRWNGRLKHPVLLPKREFRALKSSATLDLKQFLGENEELSAAFDAEDPGLDLDIDRPEDYKQARRLFGSQ